jgi:magnesium chelatase family protein
VRSRQSLLFCWVSYHECTRTSKLISRHQKRLSGPLLDRIDIRLELPRVPFRTCPSAAPRAVPRGTLSDQRRGEPSAAIRARVEAGRARQTVRFAGSGRGDPTGRGASSQPVAPKMTNADMGPTEVRDHPGPLGR